MPNNVVSDKLHHDESQGISSDKSISVAKDGESIEPFVHSPDTDRRLNKIKLTILTSALLVFASAALYILYNINRNLKLEYINKINSANNNQVISDINKSFFIDLPIDPTTGYLWQAEYDSTVLKLADTNFNRRQGDDKTGTENFQTFELQALVKSNTSITFNSVRSWETDAAPKDIKVYDVSIR